MSSSGEYAPDPVGLPIEEMHEALLEHGWLHSVSDNGIGTFSRQYPRISLALDSDMWRTAVYGVPNMLNEYAPYLSQGSAIHTEVNDTELAIWSLGDRDSRDTVTKLYIIDRHFRELGFEEIDEEMLSDWLMLKDTSAEVTDHE